jgi:sugar phosphate isomerase/epimerase
LFGHPRLSVSALSSWPQTMREDVAMWQELGVDHVSLLLQKIDPMGADDARALATGASLDVETVFGPREPARLDVDPSSAARADDDAAIARTIEFAASVAARSVYICTGSAGSLSWEDAAEAFCAAIEPSRALAQARGLPLALEPTNTFRGDVSFVFSLRDVVDLARAAGLGVVLDLHACWFERGFARLVRENLDLFVLVQVSDFVLGTFDTPNRAVPGDGDVPLERLLGIILDAGYEGAFDLELIGPRIDQEGYPSAIRRAAEHTGGLLHRLGA